MGDGVLVEFASAVNAVEFAVAVQEGMHSANAEVPEDRKIVLRIGINLGDVMVEGSDLYGDGVNIASRLEAMAEPGGILISGTAHDYVRNKTKFGFEDLGDQTLKNIAGPVRVHRISGAPHVEVAVSKATADKPSIAVLPFINMSGNPEQEYFSDGITEDIITELSRYPELFVVARSSSFAFLGKDTPATEVGRILGVAYLLDGSLRRVGGRIRVSVQLIEADTGRHIWAERYDRNLEDVFAIQVDIAQIITATLVGHIERTHAEQTRRKPTSSWAAYDYVLQARQCVDRYDLDSARNLLRRAVEIDPGYANAHAMLAWAGMGQFFLDSNDDTLSASLASAEKALLLDDNDFFCHCAMGLALIYCRRFDAAEMHLDRAVALNPNSTLAAVPRANLMTRVGRTQEALQILDMVALRDPVLPPWYWEVRSLPLLVDKRYEEMIQTMNRMSPQQYYDHACLAAAYAYLGREKEAHAEAAEVLRLHPDFSIAVYAKQEPFKNPADLDHLLEGMRKAGLPE
jgi:TolB-like protein